MNHNEPLSTGPSYELLRQLKDETSPFYNYKMVKRDKPRADPRWKDQITADDICWALGGPYLEKSYLRARSQPTGPSSMVFLDTATKAGDGWRVSSICFEVFQSPSPLPRSIGSIRIPNEPYSCLCRE